MPTAQNDDYAINLAAALKADLMRIHSEGGTLLGDPEAIPILAELALAPARDPVECAEAVEQLLHTSLGRLRRFDRFSSHQLRLGLAELLGIGEKPWKTQADRFDNAAAELSYASGDSLRKTRRKKDDTRWLWEALLDLLATQLLELATAAGFSPTGRFGDGGQAGAQPFDASRLPAKYWEPFVEELHWIFVFGLRDAIDQDRVPALLQLADSHNLAGDGDRFTKMTQLLQFAINQLARGHWPLSFAECENTIRDLAKLPGDRVPVPEKNRGGFLAIDDPDHLEYSIGRFIETSRDGEKSIDLAELAKPLALLIKKDPLAESLSRDWEITKKLTKRRWEESVKHWKESKRTRPQR